MKNTKEVQAILTAICCINQTSEHKDEDIAKILDYAFRRLFGSNTNLLMLCCVGRSKEEIMPEIIQVLEQDTQYKNTWRNTRNEGSRTLHYEFQRCL